MPPVLLALREVEKAYGGLRPLRIRELTLHEGETLALTGIDGPSAEVLVDLITGSTLPDRGTVEVFGTSTAAVPDGGAWLALLDRFGMLSPRAVLLDAMTAAQNLALPFSLELNPIPPSVMADVTALATDVGLADADLLRMAASLDPLAQLRLRLGRALALKPGFLLAEHPNALVPPEAVKGAAQALSDVVERRALTLLVLTADEDFARATATHVRRLDPATGEARTPGGWSSWFRRG